MPSVDNNHGKIINLTQDHFDKLKDQGFIFKDGDIWRFATVTLKQVDNVKTPS